MRSLMKKFQKNEEGGIAISLIMLMPVLIIAVGIVVDTATKYQGNEMASQVAQSAANAAANAVGGSAQDTGQPTISPGYAEQIARNYVAASGLTTTLALVNGDDMAVNVTGTVPTKFLSLLGIGSLPVKGSAHASIFVNK